ncbi:MAG: hypothetical protein R2912_01335 [Eubacteriales bacterium]
MNQRIQPLRRIGIALFALLSLAFATGCSLFDPVVSVGSPSPDLAVTPQPAETSAPATPMVTPQKTPSPTEEVLPTATPGEANGAGAYTIAADVNESKKTYYSESEDENALRVENGAIAGVDGARVEKRSGDATSLENVLQYGLNAAVLTRANAQLLLLNSDVTAKRARRGRCLCV